MSRPRGAERVRAAFARAADEGRSALIVYLVAGHPDEPTSVAAARAVLDAGADLLEVGIPFSDPVADGPVIAAAGQASLAAGGGVDGTIRIVRSLRRAGYQQPLLAMSYLNPLVARGRRAMLAELAGAGLDGLIVPDLPAGEDRQVERDAADAGLGMCFLVTPNSSDTRTERAIRASTGFLYVVPLLGVTGARDQVATAAVPLLERMRAMAASRVPVAVGFGVSRAEHVRELAPAVDGVIVGSAVVAALTEGGPGQVAALVRTLAGEAAIGGGWPTLP